MRNLTRAFLLVAVMMMAAATCAGQRGATPKYKMRKMSAAGSAGGQFTRVISGTTTKVREVGQAWVWYVSKPSDFTIVDIELPGVSRQQGHLIDLSATYAVNGKKVVRPDLVEVQVRLDANSGVFKKGDHLALEDDGKVFNFREVKHLVDITENPEEALVGEIDFAAFEKIVGGKTLKVRAAGIAFELNEAQREALRDLLRAMETVK